MTSAHAHHAAPRTPAARGAVLRRLMITLLALAGCAVLLYPAAGNWFTDRAHAAEVTGYTETVESLPEGERAAVLERAYAYNTALADGRTVDLPEPGTERAGAVEAGADVAGAHDAREATAYLDQLTLPTSSTMARLLIPAVGVSLPVYHGTEEETLTRGLGHLQGSALPVGGLGTNSVLTGHSGVPEARLFTNLHDLDGGELVSVDVLGETLTYQVYRIDVVLPTQTDLLQPVAGQDLLTLVTCTPVGVNSHRLVVQAHRVDAETAPGATTVGGTDGPGFPWWAALLGAAAVGGTAFVLWPTVTRRRRPAGSRPTSHLVSPRASSRPRVG